MPQNNGKITAPVSVADVRLCIGEPSLDVATLCSCKDKINKASKYKPIRQDTPLELNPESGPQPNRLGSNADQLNGIFYGVKMVSAVGDLSNLHLCDYEYQNVRAGIDWARLTDWVGYDTKAVFNPVGSVQKTGFKEALRGCDITIVYSEKTSGTGIDVGELISLMQPDVNFNMGTCYPCALVTKPDGTKWVRALWNKRFSQSSTTAVNGYTTLKYNNAWYQNWRADFDGLNLAAGDTVTLTVFFIKAITGTNTGNVDFRQWKKVSGMTFPATLRAYTCPEAVAKSVKIEAEVTKALEVTSVMPTGKQLSIVVGVLTGADAPSSGASYRIEIYLHKKATQALVCSGSKHISSEEITSGNGQFFFWIDTGLLTDLPSGDYYAVWSVTRTDLPNQTACNSGMLDVKAV